MRRKISVIILTALFIGLWIKAGAAANNQNSFIDISGNRAYPQITWLVNNGIITGSGYGTFRPDDPITRAEFITIINRAFKFNTIGTDPYEDVTAKDWFYTEAARAAAAGYLPEYPDDKLEPNKQITRKEISAIMFRVLALKGFNDDDIKQFKETYDGKPGEALNCISRAEIAEMIWDVIDMNIPSREYNVKDFGARGNGFTDDTNAINKTIHAAFSNGGGTVCIPDGIYMVDALVSVRLKDNVKIELTDNAILKAFPNNSPNSVVLSIKNASNVVVLGGKIVGERNEHLAANGQWGHGISLNGCNNVHISDVTVYDCWGDGIYIEVSIEQRYCTNVVIERFNLYNNRRQGISVISVKGLTIKNGTISKSNGTDPQSGIDLEPNFPTEYLQNIYIENLHTEYNKGYGLVCWLGENERGNPVVPMNNCSITIKNHTDTGSIKGTLQNISEYIGRNYNITVL